MSDRISLEGITKIQQGSLREQILGQIKRLILTNRLRPGQLIVIDQLANELGVSHTPVREALAMLEHDGLVIIRPYKNPRVTEINASDVRDAWEMRLLLEGWAVGRTALTLSEDALDKIRKSLERARQDAQQSRYDTHLESDIALHEMILQVPENRLFERMARLVSDQSVRIRSLVEAIASPQDVLAIIDEHFALLDALCTHNAELAHQRLVSHLEAGMQRTLSALEQIVTDGEQ